MFFSFLSWLSRYACRSMPSKDIKNEWIPNGFHWAGQNWVTIATFLVLSSWTSACLLVPARNNQSLTFITECSDGLGLNRNKERLCIDFTPRYPFLGTVRHRLCLREELCIHLLCVLLLHTHTHTSTGSSFIQPRKQN